MFSKDVVENLPYTIDSSISKKDTFYWEKAFKGINVKVKLKKSKQMSTKVGFATCNAFENEMRTLEKLFSQKGLDVVCAACQIGWVTAEERCVPKLGEYINSTCNPIAQAKILNREQTEINFIIGLCLGHDILFSRYSKAPVSTLIVKDRMTGNNPAAALYGYHARRSLFKLQRSDKKKM